MSSNADLTNARRRRSSHRGSQGGDCVEIAPLGTRIAVRDSKDPHGPALAFPAGAFIVFLGGLLGGELSAR
jgi:hypothetical protein